MLRKMTILLLAGVIAFLGIVANIKPVYASPFDDLANAGSSVITTIGETAKQAINSATRCYYNSPDNAIEESSCNAAKAFATTGMLVGTCYLVDGAASFAFPPAIALETVCASLGIGQGIKGTLNKGLQVIHS
ncbi:hypothetical protein [Planktothrix prolifica]|uniref:Uncharacterized protein n=2 Tax=Microcoleaceae TaxID=1892252 RepID=A0A6J7ZM95_PLARU|nr:hypothetical protein [Planktothrix prolifica]CAC5343445.1 hypothetical protein PLAN_30633 [Planktothrix rubescens NIVA-CYA 18]CAD5979387.1 hypothetical protein PCC7821_04467 [Planktothrix rubescens NIVA-CYA 18]